MPQFELFGHPFENVLIAISLLLLLSVIGSRFSAIAGIPSLLVFLAIGMMAGSDGPGGIDFTNYPLTFVLGGVALALIIFDGGLRTQWESVRPVLPVGISLATLAVVFTAVLTGVFAHYALGLSWASALLLGAVVSSTDAAAVLSILRTRSLALKGRLRRLLEFEAGSNDPMAVLLTVSVLAYTTAAQPELMPVGALFAKQVIIGLALGWAGGKAVVILINRVGVEYEGLYSVLLLAFVVLLFAATSAVGGSGFLSAYVAGLVVGNAKLLHKTSLLKFHDGIAWIAQIALFLLLGLLVFPSHLPAVSVQGLILAVFLILVARPLSIVLAVPARFFTWKERVFVSWVGLRGAAPILLATLPWSVGVQDAEYLFNLTFFVVFVSVLTQGTTIPTLARALRLVEKVRQEPDETSGVLPAGFVHAEIEVVAGAPAENRRLFELQLPSGVVLTSLERDGRYIVPAGETRFSASDRILAFARPSNIHMLRETFGRVSVASSAG
jgi:cell volume regulation protein A